MHLEQTLNCQVLEGKKKDIESTSGQPYRYQIKITKGDVNHTVFYVDSDIYHHTVMLFGLDNVGATYLMMVNKPLRGVIGITMDDHGVDMLVKSIKGIDHFEDVRKTFECMRLHQLHLNTTKFDFGVQYGKFLDTWLVKEELN